MRDCARQGEMGGGAKTGERQEAKRHQDHYRNCHAHRAKVVQPFAPAQADHIEHSNQRQHAGREDHVVDICVGQVPVSYTHLDVYKRQEFRQ